MPHLARLHQRLRDRAIAMSLRNELVAALADELQRHAELLTLLAQGLETYEQAIERFRADAESMQTIFRSIELRRTPAEGGQERSRSAA
jgi:hypothetical protein